MRIKDENGDWQEVPALKGSTGDSLQFDWNGTELGVKTDKDAEYEYVDLKGDDGINSDMYKAVYDPTNEAKDVFAYDNTSSGMDATKIQTAIDELSVYTPVHVNLLDPTKMIPNFYINATTGNPVASGTYKCTDFIPVVAGEVYSATNDSATRPTFYDANKARTGIAGAFINFTIPEGSTFMRLSFRTITTNVMLNYGATVLTFVPYSEPEYKLKPGYKRDSIIEDLMTDATVRAYIDQFIREGGGSQGLYGLKWGCIGDSQTQYGAGSTSYMDYIAQRTGCIITNYGVGGTSYTLREDRTTSYIERYPAMADDLDIITIAGGVNDSMFATIGTMADRVGTTFYGACHLVMAGICEKYVGKRIGIISPAYSISGTLATYVAVEKEVAAYYSLPYCDLYSAGGIATTVTAAKDAMIPDNLHWNELGRLIVSRKIEAFLKTL
jgi:hypothetical protein